MGIKLNAEASLPNWLNLSFLVIPLFILIGMINASSTQECGVKGILDVDRKSQQTVNCDGSPFEGTGVSSSTVNYVALGQQIYSGAAACSGCHGANGGGGAGGYSADGNSESGGAGGKGAANGLTGGG